MAELRTYGMVYAHHTTNVMVSRAEPRHSVSGRIRFVPLLLGNMSVVETHNCVSTEVVFGRKKTVIGRNEARLTERERSNLASGRCIHPR